MEKLAAAGVQSHKAKQVYHVAGDCLLAKGKHFQVADVLKAGDFGLFSSQPLLWLRRFSSRLNKPRSNPSAGSGVSRVDSSYLPQWVMDFDDPMKAPVADVGCGLGISCLGLAAARQSKANKTTSALGIDFSACNYLGGDLSPVATRYATGVASRWNLSTVLSSATPFWMI